MVSRSLLPRLAGLALLLAVGVAAPLGAQTGSALDVITGTVTDSAGRPVAGASVEVYSLETEVIRRATTNSNGRYTIFFNDGGGQYRLTITMIGKQPFIANVTRQNDDDRIMVDVKMGDRPVVLQEMVARANRGGMPGGRDAPTPGSTERNFSAEQALRLPIDASDLAALAALVPGVIVTAGTDSTATQFSIAGQGTAANNYTVDGLTFGGDALPQDAIRNTRVITNTYDVARGQFSGGMVSASTRGGSNAVQGSISGNLRDYHLAFGGTEDVFSRGQTQQRLGLGFGGPIVRNRFFAFGSFQVDRSMQPVATLSAADAATASRLGIAPDSVTRFISLVDATGLTALAGPVDPNRNNDRYSGLLRLDWNLDAHTITARGDLRLNNQEPNRIGTTQLPQVGGTTEGSGGGAQVSVFSRLGASVTNEFRTGWSGDRSLSAPFLSAPNGRVQTLSELGDGSFSTSVLGFGGNNGLPQESRNSRLEVSEELSFFSPTAAHRYRVGALFTTASFRQDQTSNRFGTYTYESLADFESNSPSQFTRTLSPTIRDGRSLSSAFFVSDVWRPTSNLQLTFGGRLERSWYSGAPGRNTAAEERFGIRTDVLPTETAFTPRFGFSYSIAAAEQRGESQRGFAPPRLTIRGGLGVFRGTMPGNLPGTAQAQSGLRNTEAQLICVGDAVPLPNWDAFGDDTGSIPTACVGPSTPATSGVPNITTWAEDFGAARTVRGSLGLSKRFWNTWSFNLDGSYTKGLDQSASRDLNLRDAPVFHLGGQDQRPVYADPSQILATSGTIPLTASRVDPAYGRVSQVFSALENTNTQLTAAVSTVLRRGATLNFSYSWMRTRDQGGSDGGGGVITSGDPLAFEWARSSGSRTHNIQMNLMWPFSQSLEISAVGRITSGTHYTPMVSGDINGDGSRNDIAFIYDPAAVADPTVAAGMDRLLGTLDGAAAECLRSQLGRVATRNSCTGPWQPSLDLQLNWRPGMFANRLALSFSTMNLLGGLDELFHGADGLKGWGGFARPNSTLLQVTGFDAATQQFRYVVNERFGATGGSATAVRSPFQVGVQLRYTIGRDRMRDMRRNFFGGNGQPSLAQQMLARFDSLAPNTAREVLARKDSLVLDPRQVASLQALVDSSAARTAPLLDSLRTEVERGGTNPDMQKLFGRLGELQRAALVDRDSTIAAVRRILTDAQWALLPEAVRNPPRNPFMGGRGGAGGPGGAGGAPAGGGRPVRIGGMGRDGE